ncbi:NAD(+) diphosphatase [Pseudonocardiaceae bacterium YIM PH 21723]|nr:NAD(+) diphosphatase [Pseudonocardiaceae bacterium YIM PH 21723]
MLTKLLDGGRLLVLDEHFRVALRPGESTIAWLDAAVAGSRFVSFLGYDGETAYWACRLDHEALGDEVEWEHLRVAGSLLDDEEAGLFATAAGLLAWQQRSRFCTNCGTRVDLTKGGWATQCSGCDTEEYPRTDPAVICLVHDGADRVLLARGTHWPRSRFSTIAGFVETGESLEACVRREIHEEVGVVVSDIRYLASQPWPLPRSLMLGFAAKADPAAELNFADGEIAEARWFHRDEVRAALEAATIWNFGPDPEDAVLPDLILSGRTSIAHHMIRAWAFSD